VTKIKDEKNKGFVSDISFFYIKLILPYLISRGMMEPLLNRAFECVRQLCVKYNVDESHAMKHSMDVFNYIKQFYHRYIPYQPQLAKQQPVLYAAAILHDMCDPKYVTETEGLRAIHSYMEPFFSPEDFNMLSLIMTTISYSKVRKNGFPILGDWQFGYHMVRESDLLASYDFDRCIMYGMYRESLPYVDAVARARTLYHNRVLQYIKDGVFLTDFGLSKAYELHGKVITIYL